MLIATGLMDTSTLSQSSTGAAAMDQALPGVSAQGLIVTLFGVAGALFLFAAINKLRRLAPVRVRKQ